MKKLILGLGVMAGAIGLLCAANARAGTKGTFGISVTSEGGLMKVSGQLGNIRASSNSGDFITCWVESWGDGEPPWTTCIGRSGSGSQVQCSSVDPYLAQVALGISGDSYVAFHRDQFNKCVYLEVENGSTMAPKTP